MSRCLVIVARVRAVCSAAAVPGVAAGADEAGVVEQGAARPVGEALGLGELSLDALPQGEAIPVRVIAGGAGLGVPT